MMKEKKREKNAPLRKRLRVVNEQGVHLRAAGEIVKLTARYKSEVTLTYKGETVNGKSLMSIISLALPPGAFFFVCARGKDAAVLLEEFGKLVAAGFGEKKMEE